MDAVIDLPRTIDDNLAADIEKESVYVSPHLSRLCVTADRKAVEVRLASRENNGDVHGKVERFLDAMLQNVRKFDTKIFYRNRRRDEGPFATQVQEELSRRKWIFDYGNGQVALSGPALALACTIDSQAARLYQQHLGAAPGMFPAFINAGLLARCGYFDSHPNVVTFVGHHVEDFDAIEEFRQANGGMNGGRLPRKKNVRLPGMCLNPAACFPCYPTLEGETVGPEGRVFTWLGRVFRYESRNIAGLERLWEFNVRELVFVGTEEFVVDCRRRTIPIIGELASELDLDCRIETATDPFFATVSAAKSFWQQTQEVKNEIRLPIEPGADGAERTTAAGSINLHGSFFGNQFNIKVDDGTPALTACVGLGIERWVLAAFSQHGFDPRRWPAAVRSDIFG